MSPRPDEGSSAVTHFPVDESRESWPSPGWTMIDDLAAAGWSLERLSDAFQYAGTIATDAVMIVQNGREVASWGDITRRYNCHSMRKSFLSALMGPYVEDGTIDLSLTLAALDIDDVEGLTAVEKQATVYDLLTARSGIYHPAGYETPWMRSIKPLRHSQAPGTEWCYSNWDFNALGTIFTQLTGRDIHEAFRDRIAQPLGMEDFRHDDVRKDGWLVPDACSRHPAYPFAMSSRDLARFGLMFLRDGRWGPRQVIPADWVATSLLPYSDAGARGAYGYMWWLARAGTGFPGVVQPEGSFSAQGAGGHVLVMIPPLDLVIVHRVDTAVPGRAVDLFQFGKLLRLILDARRAVVPR
ncbi:beta-lactamase family protein [Rhodopseudomonas sp. P2A-2r]|uniref:serine hydrolase domain-containing protein n=1 Tax=Rhodopseudomonas sp. P2A-2r TaxID=2991972 RepID=UPI002234E728|nr:serine hydrolase [Rhodopseudomonas sp. P2A-2r]UZE49950.1 beta-lactamase family protein [Rhodopseudomonas sp. P2A-2r]